MRKLLAQFIIRRVWQLAVEGIGTSSDVFAVSPKRHRADQLSDIYNLTSLIITALGANCKMPEDVFDDFVRRREQAIAISNSGDYMKSKAQLYARLPAADDIEGFKEFYGLNKPVRSFDDEAGNSDGV